MGAPANPFVKKSNFNSVEYAVVFQNTTTQTEIRAAGKVKIVELGDDWMSIRIPRTAGQVEHHLLLHVMPKNDVAKLSRGATRKPIIGAMSITAVIKELTPVTGELNVATLQFLQYNEKDWKEFLEKWGNIQKESDKLLKAIRGR